MEINIQILDYQQYLNNLPEDTQEEIQKKTIAMETLTEFIDIITNK